MAGVVISSGLLVSVSLIRVLSGSSATRSPLIETSTCSVRFSTVIEVRPTSPPSGSLCSIILNE